jgi:hypothetical protein
MAAPGLAPRINPINFPSPNSVSFDLDAFNDGIKAHGLLFEHWRAMRDPVGLIEKHDARRPNPGSKEASNGCIYTKAGIVRALCLGNTKETKASDAGLVDSSQAQFTPISEYEDTGKRVFLANYDRLLLQEESVLVTRHELLEASPTGVDRPKFPAVEILDCVDARGQRYFQDTDFSITQDGLIVWKDRRPGQEIDTGKGVVFGIRYVYRPFWIVARMIHEIRMVQTEDFLTGQRKMVQAPQSALIYREFYFESEAADSGGRAAEEGPPDGQITAR